MRTRLLAGAVIALSMSFAALPASASFILGAITLSGDFTPTGGQSIGDATGIDFIGDDFGVDGATDDFASAGIGQGDVGAIADFDFAPFGAISHALWTIGGFTFDLQSVQVVFQNPFLLALTGVGEVSGNGFLPTFGSWNLTANAAGTLFNFSSGTNVPEPGTLLLIGLGTVGFGFARRRRR